MTEQQQQQQQQQQPPRRHEPRPRRSLQRTACSSNRSHLASFLLGALCVTCITWVQPSKLKLLVEEAAAGDGSETLRNTDARGGVKVKTILSQTYNFVGLLRGDKSKSNNQATIMADHHESCRHFPQSVDAFVEDVADQTEQQSLTRWEHSQTTTNNNATWIFPQLDRDLLATAFGGKRVAFVGDSTMFYLMQWLYQLMVVLPEDFVQSMATSFPTQTTAMRAVEVYLKTHGGMQHTEDFTFQRRNHYNNKDNKDDKDNKDNKNNKDNNKAHIIWKGFNGGNMRHNCEFDTLVWPQVLEHKPEIMVANWGLHTLFRPKVQECNVPQYLNYETFFLERTLQTALEVGTKLVLFKTTNLMCKDERVTLGKHQLFCNKTLLQQHHQSLVQRWGLNDTQLLQYCDETAFVEASSRRLNDRLAKFVAAAKVDPQYANITIEIYNDHDLESCSYTQWNDGVHFQLLAFPRLRLLAHMISCLWKE